MNFTEIVARVAAEDTRSTAGLTTGSSIWVNEAKDRICQAHNFSFMKTSGNLTVATAEVAGPTGLKDVISMHIDATGDPIIYPIDYATGLRHYGDTTGTIAYYSKVGDQKLYFFPAPSASTTVKLHYYKYIADMTGTDTNYITNNMPDLLIAGALSRAFLYLQETEYYAAWEQKFMALLQSFVARDLNLTVEEVKQRGLITA